MPALAHDIVTEGDPTSWLYVLHGIYGAGRNWGSVARRVVRSRPEWGAVLVDLRQHGGSQNFAPPHTIEAAASDVAALEALVTRPAGAVLGHSFGGKVALMLARLEPGSSRQLWIVDSTPDAGEPRGSAWEMLQVVRGLPAEYESRQDAVAALEAEGIVTGTAQWMATNLEREDGVYRWRIDLDDMEALLHSFFETDLWDVVEAADGPEIHFVRAEESSVLSPEAERRIDAAGERVRLHRVAGGHWVNAENPEAIEALLTEHLPR